MRTAFVETLTALAEKDERVWLVTGDLGFSVFEEFAARFPDRYLNVGVAEQDLIGVSAGLALSGLRPFAYSISTFASMRAYEQIRNDVCYQNLPVVIVGGGSTFSYSTFGATHMPLEDAAIMRVLPHMRVLMPGDPAEVRALLAAAHEQAGPAYMRIAKKGEPTLHAGSDFITLGTMSLMREGTDGTIIVSGRQLPNALAAADLLAGQGIRPRVLSAHTLKPFDTAGVIRAAKETGVVLAVEEHSRIGGLASAIADTLASARLATPFAALAVPDVFPSGVGSQDFFLGSYGLTPGGIVRALAELRA